MITNKKSPDKIVFVYTTCSDRDEARHLGFSAVEEKLAICADFWAIESIYPWQNVIQDADQFMVMFTTEKTLAKKLAEFIAGLHSYTVPMISECDTAFMNAAYSAWAEKTLQSDEEYISETQAEKAIEILEEDGYHPGKLK